MTLVTNDFNYGPPDFIVDPVLGRGTHQTIAAAIAQAITDSKSSIFLHDATYVEDLTIPSGLTIWADSAGNLNGRAIIEGTLTFTDGINSLFANIRFRTNSITGTEILVFDGAGSGQSRFTECSFFFPDADMLTCSNSSSSPTFRGCNFHQTGNNNAFWTITQCGNIQFTSCTFLLSATAGTSNIAAGVLDLRFCVLSASLSTSGSGFYRIRNCTWDGSNQNLTFLTAAGTGNATNIRTLNLNSGSAVAITVGAGSTVESLDLHIESSNATPITGTGTFDYDLVGSSRRDILIDSTTLNTNAGATYTGAVEFNDRTDTPVAGSTVTSNSLDFYEEGTWTATITSLTPPDAITFSDNEGVYTRIGNLCHVDASLTVATFTLGGGSGAIRILGIPFPGVAVGSVRYSGSMVASNLNFNGSAIWLIVQNSPPNDYLNVIENFDNAGAATATIEDIQVGTVLRVSLTYRV